MDRNWRRVPVGLVAALIVIPLGAGCDHTDDDMTSKALTVTGAFGGSHDLCLSTWGRRYTYTVGLDLVQNVGPAPVSIDAAEWSAGDGLELLDVRFLEVDSSSGFAAFGTAGKYPPTPASSKAKRTPEIEAWEESKPAVGTTLPTTGDSDDHYLNLVIGFRGTDDSAAGPLRVDYTDAEGNHGTLTSAVTFRLAKRC